MFQVHAKIALGSAGCWVSPPARYGIAAGATGIGAMFTFRCILWPDLFSNRMQACELVLL